MNARTFRTTVEQLHDEREYRPVGAMILYNEDEEFLLVRSAKGTRQWIFPQEGIKPEETRRKNLLRGLEAELGIKGKDLEGIVYGVHYGKLAAPRSRSNRRGFSRGKAYFFVLAKYIGDGQLQLAEGEIEDARWMPYGEAVDTLKKKRKVKYELSKAALDKAVELLEKQS